MGRIYVLHALTNGLVVICGNDRRLRRSPDRRVTSGGCWRRFERCRRRIDSLSHVVLNSIVTLLAMTLCRSGDMTWTVTIRP